MVMRNYTEKKQCQCYMCGKKSEKSHNKQSAKKGKKSSTKKKKDRQRTQE